MERPQNVCLMCYNISYAGAQTQMLELARSLDIKKYAVRICIFNKNIYLKDDFKNDDIHIDIVEYYHKYDFGWLFRLFIYLYKHNYDILYTFLSSANVIGLMLGKMAKIPLIISSERNSNYPTNIAARFLLRFVLQFSDYTIANSYSGKDFLKQTISKKYEPKIRVIYNGRNFNYMLSPNKKTEVEQELDIPANCRIIVLVARFRPGKNHIMFFNVAKILLKKRKDLIFLCIGDEDKFCKDYYDDLMVKFKFFNMEEHFRFLGARKDVLELLALADVSVLTSLHEGISNTMIESLAVGCPVVVTDVSDNKKIIRNGHNGYVVPVDNANDMARKTLKILNDDKLKRHISIQNKELARKLFSTENMVKDTERIFQGIYEP